MSNRYYSKDQDIHFQMTTLEEEQELFRKSRAGDEKAREFLIHNHLLFVAMQAQAMAKGGLERNEVISAANEALMQALDLFDPERGVRFSTYLRLFILGSVKSLWRSKFAEGATAPPEMASHISDESRTVEELDLSRYRRECVAKALLKLSKPDAELIRLRYIEDQSFADIGRTRGVTRAAIQQAHARIVKRLRFLLTREEIEE